LGGDKEAVDAKLFNCIRTAAAFSNQGVRDYITQITKDNNIWN